MTEPTQPVVAREYLRNLEESLAGVPADVRVDILAGVAEELAGLDAPAAAARIEELGDPVFIAAEARAESGGQTPASGTAGAPGEGAAHRMLPTASATATSSAAPTPYGDPRWYSVLASLLVAFGGVIVPVLGWVAGLAIVWLSKTWTTAEKWVATVTGPLAILAAIVLTLSMRGGGLMGWHFILVLLVPVNVVVGIWLLWRALRRNATFR